MGTWLTSQFLNTGNLPICHNTGWRYKPMFDVIFMPCPCPQPLSHSLLFSSLLSWACRIAVAAVRCYIWPLFCLFCCIKRSQSMQIFRCDVKGDIEIYTQFTFIHSIKAARARSFVHDMLFGIASIRCWAELIDRMIYRTSVCCLLNILLL